MSRTTLMTTARLACALLITIACISPTLAQSRTRRGRTASRARKESPSARISAAPAVVPRYIEALKNRDFKTVIDLTLNYQQTVAQIKAANPRALWSRRIDEYYSQQITNLTEAPSQWGDYGRSS